MNLWKPLLNSSIAVLGLIGVSQLQAATITPNIFTDPALGGEDCSLRAAIQSIENQVLEDGCDGYSEGALGTNDTINLAAGTYELTLEGNGENDNATGDLDLESNDVAIVGAGSTLTTIDASGIPDRDRIFDFDEIVVSLSGLTLRGGDLEGLDDKGGAIKTDETTLTLNDVVIVDNQASEGGGIAYDGRDGDDGIQLVIINSTIDSNRALGFDEVEGDEGGCGGGISISDGVVAITNSTISRNEATVGSGGGICQEVGADYLFLTNSTISSNYAQMSGGGIYTASGFKGSYNVTIAFNQAVAAGGGIFNAEAVKQDNRFEAEIFNTIVAQNTAALANDCAGVYLSGGNNLIGQIGQLQQPQVNECIGFTNGTNGDQVGTPAAPINPLLVATLDSNGGLTRTHALQVGSPAIDRGNATACQALDFAAFTPFSDNDLEFFALEEDQRGSPRPVAILDPNASICDIGAYEFQVSDIPDPTPTPTPTPTATATPVPPFVAFVEGSGCVLGAGSAQSFPSLSLLAGLAALALPQFRRRAK